MADPAAGRFAGPRTRRTAALWGGVLLVVVALLGVRAELAGGQALARGHASAGADPAVEVLGAVEVAETDPGAAPVELVRVVAHGCGGRSTGSGIVLGDGLVLTARHVLDGAVDASVIDASGVASPATVVALAEDGRDSAILSAPDLDRSTPAPSVAQEVPDEGTTVAVLGHPGGGPAVVRSGTLVGSLSSGPLSIDGGRVLTLDLVVEPGMSGGPVVDEDGRLLGVAIGYDHATRTGIAVPIDSITELLDGRGEVPRPSC